MSKYMERELTHYITAKVAHIIVDYFSFECFISLKGF